MSDAVRGWRDHLKIVAAVVALVVVLVVDVLARTQEATEDRARNEAVLVNVPADVRERVPRSPHENVSVTGDDATAAPVRISGTEVDHAHGVRVASTTMEGNRG